jgi:hypothetical protein
LAWKSCTSEATNGFLNMAKNRRLYLIKCETSSAPD